MSIKSHDVRYLAQLINSSINALCLHHNLLHDSDKFMLREATWRLQKISDSTQNSNLAEVTLECPDPAINLGFYSQERQDA